MLLPDNNGLLLIVGLFVNKRYGPRVVVLRFSIRKNPDHRWVAKNTHNELAQPIAESRW